MNCFRPMPMTMFLQCALLSGGLALSVGSSSTRKASRNAVTIVEPDCSASRSNALKQKVDAYVLSCRYNGGDPSSKFITKKRACPAGTVRHGAVISCDGAAFAREVLARAAAKRPSVRRRPAAASDTAAVIAAILKRHNAYRAELNLKPLTWNDTLAKEAARWAAYLAKQGGARAIASDHRKTGQGENIWIGRAGSHSVADMISAWGAQKKYFIPGAYPRVSTTGKVEDVSQYTQMIWRATMRVGCALIQAGGNDILVCRYWPPGNVAGRKPL